MSILKPIVNPPDLEECQSYTEFKRDVQAWSGMTHVEKKIQGGVIAYNLSNNSKFGHDLKDYVYAEHEPSTLNNDEAGLDKVLKVLDKYLEKAGLSKAADTWDKFLDIKRKPDQPIKQYIPQFEKVCQGYTEHIGALTELGKALHLLRTANISETQYELILAVNNKSDDLTGIYKNIKDSIMVHLSDRLSELQGNSSKEVRQEQAFLTDRLSNEELEEQIADDVYAASFYQKQAWKKKQMLQQNQNRQQYSRGTNRPFRGSSSNQGTSTTRPQQQQQTTMSRQNQSRPVQGQQDRRCNFCRSKTHFIKDCIPYKKMKAQYLNNRRFAGYQVNYTTEEQEEQPDQNEENDNQLDDLSLNGLDIQDNDWQSTESQGDQRYMDQPGSICLSDNIKGPELSRFTNEALNCAALDTCCSQTVAGYQWLQYYLRSLPKDLREAAIGPQETDKQFRFGNNQLLTSKEKWELPVFLGDRQTFITVYIIPSDIPMLMSKSDLQANDAILYMKEDKAKINGKMVDLSTTTAGHYIVNLLEDKEMHDIFITEDMFDEIFAVVDLKSADEATQLKTLRKLHAQFGHRPKQAFIDLLKHANAWMPSFSKMLDKIIDPCEGCVMRRRHPDKPSVAMPMAKDVNDVIAMDLKKLKNGKHILYIIDMFSRFTMAKIVNTKKPGEIINGLMDKWISVFGIPGKILTDNGGEFCNEEMLLLANKFNIEHNTTGAESPWENGTCEKNHGTCDNIYEALEEDNPKVPQETLLNWALVAKNSLLMVQGFSPYQLVFGKNPKLPNIITDPLPTWDDEGISGALLNHLKAMKAARQEFIKQESSLKLKKALETKVRTNNTTYKHGDRVYFKRANYKKWFSGKVVFQDGKLIMVSCGNFFYKCSANRVIKANSELANKDSETQEENPAEPAAQTTPTQELTAPQNNQPEETRDPPEKENPMNTTTTSLTAQVPHNDTTRNTPQVDNDNNSEISMQPLHGSVNGNENTPMNNTANTLNDETSINETTDKKATNKQKRKNLDTTTPNTYIPPKLHKGDLVECKLDGVWRPGQVHTLGGKVGKTNQHWYNITFPHLKDTVGVNTEIVETKRTTEENILALWVHEEIYATIATPDCKNSDEGKKAMKEELEKLKNFGTYTEIPDCGQEAITTTWVLTKKGNQVRARLTARGYEEESNVRSDSPTVQSTSLRFLLMTAALNNWNVCCTDIKSAFLQGKMLDRKVYIKPPKEADAKGKLWLLNKCLYGLTDASRQWYEEVDTKFEDQGLTSSCQDSALYLYKENDELKGMIAVHVDDFLHAGDEEFERTIIPRILENLVVGKTEVNNFTYTGFHIEQQENGIKLDQHDYLKSIELPTLDAKRMKETSSPLEPEETTILRQIMGKVNWVIRATRPDMAYDMVHISSKFHNGSIEDIKQASKAMSNMQRNKAYINIPNLEDANNIELWCFSDASHGNINDRQESVIAYIIFAANKDTKLAAPIAWKAGKPKRTCLSTLEAETLAMEQALTAAIGIQLIGEECFNIKIPIFGVVDNYSSYESIRTNRQVSNARLRREIHCIKQMQKHGHVEKVMWLQGSEMLADCMTKRGMSGVNLLQTLQTGYLGDSMDAANATEYFMTYDPSQDNETNEYQPMW